MKVLIVDDVNENLYLLDSLLKGIGCQVVSARNGAEALKKLEKNDFQLIISDILMPVMDGFKFCKKVKEDIKFRSTPFVFYTASYTEDEDKDFALKLGADKFILKPKEPEEFMEIIQKVINEMETSKIKPIGSNFNTDEEYYKQYSERLVTKLEKKMRNLEKEIYEHKKAKKEIQKLNEELERRVVERTAELTLVNKELESFSYSVSHDLKAPLRHINGYIGLLEKNIESSLNEKSVSYLERVHICIKEMDELIEGLLSLSQIVRTEIWKRTLDLESIVQKEVKTFQEEGERKIDWIVGRLPQVYGDNSMIKSVMINLMSNAIKFTKSKKKVKIEIGSMSNSNEIIIFVRDNGVGFDMQYADKLFCVFQSLHRKEDFEGTGIGLANVRRIIHRHGGKVWADGELGKGATFYFSLPYFKNEAEVTG